MSRGREEAASKLLLLLPAGLAHRHGQDPAVLPRLHGLLGERAPVPLRPPFPAVTSTVQATLTTGAGPGRHGVVANGLYLRDLAKVSFWEQSGRLVRAPRLWDVARKTRPELTVALLCVQQSWLAGADILLTPWPVHAADGRTVSSCYSTPADLYDRLRAELGDFPLHHYWGPLAGPASSRWIAAAAARVLDGLGSAGGEGPDLAVVYLPHLDYDHQRHGPDSPQGLAALAELDELAGGLVQHARGLGYRTLLASDYALAPVSRCVHLNRALRQEGWLAVRTVAGREYLDTGGSRAFAMADHQAAHLYLADPADAPQAARLAAGVPGVEQALAGRDRAALDLEHPAAGDVVCVAEAGAWFGYEWWDHEERAPDFAATVDIHRKPGYDPLELFLQGRGTGRDPALLGASHGRIDGPAPMLWTDLPASDRLQEPGLATQDVAALVLEALGT